MLILTSQFKKYFSKKTLSFNELMAFKGEVFRKLEGRCTQKIILGNEAYFIKHHFGVGWKEIFKNLSQLRLPIISAKNEWLALRYLQTINIASPEIVGYGIKGINPARLKSFIITKALPETITLEDFCKCWPENPPTFKLKQAILKKVAYIARTLHLNGINHRDFYICHFLLDSAEMTNLQIKLYLIDLHRAQIRKLTPERWIIKDLSGLFFSSKEIGLTTRDVLRFIKEYRNNTLRTVLNKELKFWLKVKTRGDKLYREHQK